MLKEITNSGGVVVREEVVKYFPNLSLLHPDTRFQLYREVKGNRGIVEYTLFYREPGKIKMRLDAELDLTALNDGEVKPESLKIIQLYDASKAVL